MNPLLIIALLVVWTLVVFGFGFSEGEKWQRYAVEMQKQIDAAIAATAVAKAETARLLTAPLACPVCGAGRSNLEVSQGWCANCGVYHDA